MELEMKFWAKDLLLVKSKLEKMGFEFIKSKHQIDTYYMVDKLSERGSYDYLRLREILNKSVCSFEYTQVWSDLETEEHDVEVSNRDSMMKILGLMGYDVLCVVDKQREEYQKGRISVVMDRVKDLGEFVEVEIMDVNSKENEDMLLSVAEQLGVRLADRVLGAGYPDLILNNMNSNVTGENDAVT